MRIAPSGWWQVRRLRRVSPRGAGYPPGGLANRRRPPMHRPLRADRHGPHCRALAAARNWAIAAASA